MNDVQITVLPRETVSFNYSGIHSGTLRLTRGSSWVDAAVGDIFRQPVETGDVIERKANFFLADASDDAELRYGLFAPDGFHKSYHLHVWIDGPAFTGGASDKSILRRIELRSENSPACDVTYRFGWDVQFGEKPFFERRKR